VAAHFIEVPVPS